MDLSKKIEIANCYKFFAECFYFPEENQLKTINNYKKNLPQNLGSLIDYLEAEKELQIEFSKLFVGPFKVLASPYGSVYLEEGNTAHGDSTLDVIKIYQEENLQVDLKEPADHIAIELEFMYYLASKEIEAIENNDLENANLYLNKQYSFIQRHLSQWIPEFTNSIISNTKNEFYKKMATALNLMIKEEHSLINLDN
jgi:putative dimethyl sulfoxide reductase chaperone